MKDPAALVYIDKWSSATKGMRGCEKGWYFDLILYQFDKGSIPNDFDTLASICSVRPSEFDLFKQVFEQVLKHKFKQNLEGSLENPFASDIIQKRQRFLDKRSNAGKISYILRFARKNFKLNKKKEAFLKDNVDVDIDLKNEQVLKHMLEQKLELYINEDEDINEDVDINKSVVFPFETNKFKEQWEVWKNYKNEEFKFKYKSNSSEQAALAELNNLSNGQQETAIKIIHQSMAKGWKGFFELKNDNNGTSKNTYMGKKGDWI